MLTFNVRLKMDESQLTHNDKIKKLSNNIAEIIVHLPRRRKHFHYPTAIPDIVRVDKMNILDITVSDTLTFHRHISALVAKSARLFYAVKTIRAHGLNGNALWDVTLVSQLLYASPAWWGYLKADERNRLQAVIKKAIRYGYLPRSFSTLDELREDSDEKLFSYPGTTPTMFYTASSPT